MWHLDNVCCSIEVHLDRLSGNHRDLELDHLKECIIALGLWPSEFKNAKCSEYKMAEKLKNLLISLETGSFERIWKLKLPEDSPHYLGDAPDRLDLADAWMFALTGGKFIDRSKNLSWRTFPTKLIKIVTDRKDGK